jgi:hypothetical protein
MKIFIAYRFTGEDFNELEKILGKIKSILESKGGDIFCSLFFEEHFKNRGFSTQGIFDYCLRQLKEHGIIFFFIKSREESKGMRLELEEAIRSNKKIILAIRENLNFKEFRQAASQVIEFNELPDLYESLTKKATLF